ncbi:expressed unknown protein [Seminavis robusta]|uniref:Uncharacterized protein n=1 Tax=Seminavis robusta TaxID=568900 RepID=A0A9N8DN84_9STRA|nr:expressed unknown protein [Seminavis robusta]|eukprot:Sro149_g068480.1 n/a (1061) ;mRNA; f:54191-57567
MNFCGGAVERQVHETPVVKFGQHHSVVNEDKMLHPSSGGQQYHHHVDLPVHPSCMVTSSQPQNSSSSSTAKSSSKSSLVKIAKKKLQQSSATGNSSSSGQSNNHHHSKSSTTTNSTPRSRSRSRSTGRSRGKRKSQNSQTLEEGMSGMEISIGTPARQTTNPSARGTPSPRMLNPLSPQRIAVHNNSMETGQGLLGLPSFSNMKTLDTLLKRLENGFRVTIHNGSDPGGKRVFLTLLQNRTSLMIRPVGGDEGSTPSVKFPVRTILRLEIGKTKSSVLGRSIYDHVHPMTCFSIVVKLWTDAETYFDFEASSVIEREALISTLMVVLDQMHNSAAAANTDLSPASVGGAAWQHPRKAGSSGGETGENRNLAVSSSVTSRTGAAKPQPEVCLSPGRRTKIYSSSYFEDNGEDQQGTEISLVYPPGKTTEEALAYRSPKQGANNSSNTKQSSINNSKPLRQRQLQPAAEDSDAPNPTSPPRTNRFRTTPRDFMNGNTSKPSSSSSRNNDATKSTAAASTTKTTLKSQNSSQMEVVVVDKNKDDKSQQDEQRDSSNSDSEGGFVIMPTNQPETEIEIGLGGSPDGEIQAELSFDIASQGLPVSKIQFSPTRDNLDPQSGCCNLAPPSIDQVNATCGSGNGNQQVAWCSDDICTLALKDIAETCTGIFDNHPDNPNLEMQIDGNSPAGAKAAAERAYVEEYIAGVLGGPNSALGAFFPDGDVWNVDTSKQSSNQDKPRTSRIKNRASLLNAQALRLRTLRNEMTFAAALKRSKEKMQYVQTTKSFDDADDADRERIRQAQERSVNRLHSSALMNRVMGSMVLSKPDAEDDSVYYDSDPEDVRPRTKGVRRALANRSNKLGHAEALRLQARPVLSGVGFEQIAVGKKLRKLDESLIVQIVQAMRNETLTLMWHPTQSEKHPNRSPVCVNLWIESGVYLVDGSFLLPRLSWSVAYENNLGAKKLNVSRSEPDQIDLLDVCRIRVTEKIDRKLHPFPDPRKSFVIETQDETYLFEAQTADERNRIVYGYKLVIARLASLLMLRDSRAVEEFFGSASAMVPGGFTVGK